MSVEDYNEEKKYQINKYKQEILDLDFDYNTCNDDICKSQIKTLLEKAEHNYLRLLKED